jgi:Uma2 family endonuclease
MSSVIEVTSVHYPESDGKPMGETDEHRDEMVREIELLRRFFEGQCVYVSGNLLVYYQQGNSKRFVVPDVFVVKGLEPRRRRVYKLWVEHQAPDAIVEVTSRKTKKTDSIAKPKLYRRLGVREYFLFDPTQDYLDPPLQGYRLADGKYRRIAADARGRLVSEELGLRLQAEGGQLMLYRVDTGQRLLTEKEARQAAEAEVARLREELRRRGAD